MKRKDTILIAVIINAGLLAILFATAIIYDTEESTEQMELAGPLEEGEPLIQEPAPNLIAAASTGDEVDNVLKFYSNPLHQPIIVSTEGGESIPIEPQSEQDLPTPGISSDAQEKYVEVKVKQGDVLEKIARAHKTTVSAIKKANHLDSEWLSIGQVLKIPSNEPNAHASKTSATTPQIEIRQEPIKVSKPAEDEPVYYVIKSGDNPWKIAKQFGVKYDEILRLNKMSEEKARNLKIGDRIRVK